MGSEIGQGFDNPLHQLQPLAVYPLSETKLPTSTGIYAIVNTNNGNFYIGSTSVEGDTPSKQGFRKRFSGHRTDFRHKKQNKRFQNAYDYHGIDAFQIWILHICDPLDAIRWEQYYLDTYMPEYNAAIQAGSPKGCVHSDESKLKMSVSKAKPFRLFNSKTMSYVEGVNFRKFMIDNNLNSGCISNIMNEARWSCKGYFKSAYHYQMWLKTKERWFEIYHPEEGLIRYNGIKEFCQIRKLHYSPIYQVVHGGCFTSQGYFKNEQDYLFYLEKNKNNPQSPYSGVSWSKEKQKWCARVGYKDPFTNKRKTKNKGYFNDDYEAYLAYLEGVEELKQLRSGKRGRQSS